MKTYVDGLDGNNELKPFFQVLSQMRMVQKEIDAMINGIKPDCENLKWKQSAKLLDPEDYDLPEER